MASDDVERPDEAFTVAKQYLIRERPLSAVVAGAVVAIFLGTYTVSSVLPAVVVAVLLIVSLRFPFLQSRGRYRLRTATDVERVVEEFSGPTPPVLAFQWGIADDVTTDETIPTYSVSYLFGLRSVEMTVDTHTDTAPNGEKTVEIAVMENDRPWGTYTSTISTTDGQTIIEVEYTSNRRFGLRRLPQNLLANRYRDEALAAQGYTVTERDSQFGLKVAN